MIYLQFNQTMMNGVKIMKRCPASPVNPVGYV